MPFVKKFVDLGLHGGLTKFFHKTPLFKAQKYNFRYSETIFARPKNFEESAQIIQKMQDLEIHPGSYEWRNTTSYGGAVFSAIHNVDIRHSEKDTSYCQERFHAVVDPFPTWETTIAKIVLSSIFVSYGLPLPFIGSFGVLTDFNKTFLYLGINAFRNAVSDLVAKHGFDFKEWVNHLEHIKWQKLTDSLITTSFCFPILSFVSEVLKQSVNNVFLEPFFTTPAVFIIDASLQFTFRKLRGFSTGLALRESFRPAIGDVFALVVWLIFPNFIASSFAYLLTRKIACEIYSGYVEAVEKKELKKQERIEQLSRIFDFSRYKVPDPAAMAAINLCYITKVKSVTRFVLKDILIRKSIKGMDISDQLRQIFLAMDDDERIKSAAKFIFPFSDQKDFLSWMIKNFYKNRNFFKAYFKNEIGEKYDKGGV